MSDDRRLRLQESLENVLESEHVYFQPPENIKLMYPCIIYSRRLGDSMHADDWMYQYTQTYDIMYISKDPDDGMVQKIMNAIPGIRYDRHYTADNLHHDMFFAYFRR